MSLKLAKLPDGRTAVIIRTSDRIAFKQCRRKWGWSSHLKRNLGNKYLAAPLWFGSGIHFALEDYHGYNYFKRPSNAFTAYCIATAKQASTQLPPDAQEHFDMGVKMMDYYTDHWFRHRRMSETYWCPPVPTGDERIDAGGYGPTLPNGEPNPNFHKSWIPQVEVDFEIPIPLEASPILAAYAEALGADCVLYRGTIDRVGIDPDGSLWVIEYKTAKRVENFHYQTDPQITTYFWAASNIYTRPVSGIAYYQFVKNSPEPPRLLKSTGKISTASNLVSSGPLYRSALERMYGSDETKWPSANKDKLTELMMAETEHRDRFITREFIRRNMHMAQAEAQKILLEVEDMMNPDLPLYPNPTRNCSMMCSFLAPCVTMDDGGDWEYEIEREFAPREAQGDRFWRKKLPSIESLQAMLQKRMIPDLEGIQNTFMSKDQLERAAIEAGEPMDIPTFEW